MSSTRVRPAADPITLDIIQNSLQAISDEMFAAMRKTAMSAIIYEVLDMGTAITDGDGNLASSGAGIPAFVGVLDKARQADHRANGAGGDPARGRVRHQRSLLRRRDPSERRYALRCRSSPMASSWRGPRTSPTGTTSAAWCRARCRTRRSEIFQEGLRLPGGQVDRSRRADPSGDGDHRGEQPPARTTSGAICGPASPPSVSVSAGSWSWSRSTDWTHSPLRSTRS